MNTAYTRFFSCRGMGNRCAILWTDNAFGKVKVAFLVVLKCGKIHIHAVPGEESNILFLMEMRITPLTNILFHSKYT